jgi:hypothetical protein
MPLPINSSNANFKVVPSGHCPFFERCALLRELPIPIPHFHPEYDNGRTLYEDMIYQTQEFDFISHYYGQRDMTHTWNRLGIVPAVAERVKANR